MPPITEKDFGKKMRLPSWDSCFFIPLAITKSGSVVGEDWQGNGCVWENSDFWYDDYEEPKKKVIKRMAPALCRSDYNKEIYFLSQNIYESKEKAELDYPKKIIKWPASEAMFVEIEVEE